MVAKFDRRSPTAARVCRATNLLVSGPIGVVACSLIVSPAACHPTTGEASLAPSPAPSASASSMSVSSNEALPVPAPESKTERIAFDFEPGCAADVDLHLSSASQLDELGRLCTPGLTMLVAQKDDAGRIRVDLAQHDCVRIGIVSSVRGASASATLWNPKGQVVATTASSVPMLLPKSGLWCVEESGTYSIDATTNQRELVLEVRVWASSFSGGNAPEQTK